MVIEYPVGSAEHARFWQAREDLARQLAREFYATDSDDNIVIREEADVGWVDGGGCWVEAHVWIAPVDIEDAERAERDQGK